MGCLISVPAADLPSEQCRLSQKNVPLDLQLSGTQGPLEPPCTGKEDGLPPTEISQRASCSLSDAESCLTEQDHSTYRTCPDLHSFSISRGTQRISCQQQPRNPSTDRPALATRGSSLSSLAEERPYSRTSPWNEPEAEDCIIAQSNRAHNDSITSSNKQKSFRFGNSSQNQNKTPESTGIAFLCSAAPVDHPVGKDLLLTEQKSIRAPEASSSSFRAVVWSESTTRSQKEKTLEARCREVSVDDRMCGNAGDNCEVGSSSEEAGLSRAVERALLMDDAVLRRVQRSMQDVSSLAKETSCLNFRQDHQTGATFLNQYVVVKTLGRGNFGKVKLCLNMLDERLYAVKMINKAFVLRQLQLRPSKTLRRRLPLRNISSISGSTTPLSTACEPVVSLSGSFAEERMRGRRFGTYNNSFGIFNRPRTAAEMAGARHSLDEPACGRRDWRQSLDEGNLHDSRRDSLAGPNMDLSNPLEEVMREVAILKRLDHPNIVKLHEVINPSTGSYMMLVMENMEGGTVQETSMQRDFRSFDEEAAWRYFRQACCGLDYLHFNGVMHGDLKPENMLVSAAGALKIADFGSSRVIGDAHSCSKLSCTPAFQAPEALSRPSSLSSMAAAPGGAGQPCTHPAPVNPFLADVWALGVCLYCFLFGRMPFQGSCILDVSKAITECKVSYKHEKIRALSPEVLDLLNRIFVIDPSKRISLPDIMSHPWTKGGSAPLQTLCQMQMPLRPYQVSAGRWTGQLDRSPFVPTIRSKLMEMRLKPGEYLFREGEESTCVYMIISGVVEIVKARAVIRQDPHRDTLAKGGLMSDAMNVETSVGSMTLDIDESFLLEVGGFTPSTAARDGKLHLHKEHTQQLRERMRALFLGIEEEYVVEVRGPGQVVGELTLSAGRAACHRVSARAKEGVVVCRLSVDSFLEALLQTYGHGHDTRILACPETLLLSKLISSMAEDLGLDSTTFTSASGGGMKPTSRSREQTGPSGRLTVDSSRSYVLGSSLSTIHDDVGSWDD
ncbi:hypothetical protein CEUSTIGMA_g5625.t1 [Chlamydomonas eustigma]|uniref:cGMP-dependent protein kinase n=1 Tax=Chlamydomonas eustigma TaxID=1157962 RepID=A0A250X533_9CHLO|nr:hypothetical protein CEUSTIGMA_g5625.t1 [Chlamydomonas eustigma]|eukprot:GAX78183.1 hypothetical protein CEUSTIGMA_g5625.t1 [Chlamydomonas eustigma]